MFGLLNLVISKGIVPKGIKTDAVLVSESKEELEKLFDFNPDQIGGLKFESGKSVVNNPLKQKENKPFNIPQPVVHEATNGVLTNSRNYLMMTTMQQKIIFSSRDSYLESENQQLSPNTNLTKLCL